MAFFFSRLVQRFPDPTLELGYIVEQRSRQARVTRTMAWIVGISILVFTLVNAVFMGAESFTAVGIAQMSFIPIILVYAWIVGQRWYLTNPFVDSIFFASITPGLLISIDEVTKSGTSGWQFHAQLTYGLQLTMAFGCLAFASSVLPFLMLTLGSIGFLFGVLYFRGLETATITYTVNSYATFAALLFYVNWAIDDKARRLFKARTELGIEREKSDNLLEAVLPAPVAARLRSQEAVADDFPEVTIIFADIVGFTRISEQLGARGTVEMLNAVFSRADHGCDLFGIEKVKTIGDAYMAVAGALTHPPRPQKAAVDFSVFLINEGRRVGEELGLDIKIRIGVNTGPVLGGVISSKRLSYDYWGDTINVAARLQGLAFEDGITVSEAIYEKIKDSYNFHPPREATLKNLGARFVYDIDMGEDVAA